MFKVKSTKKVHTGDLLEFVDYPWWNLWKRFRTYRSIFEVQPLIGKKSPVGFAARDIKKDEVIEFNPSGNTKDILIKDWRSSDG